MAQIKLYSREVRGDRLPMVCMKCGAPASVQVPKRFAWYPMWVNVLIFAGLLPWALVALILTKRMTVHAPMCADHKRHWLIRSILVVGGLLFLIAFGATMFALAVSKDPGRGQPNDSPFFGLMCLGSLGGLLVLIIIAAICQATSIRPMEITDRTITLSGVSRDFIEALKASDSIPEVLPADYDERFEGERRRRKPEEFYNPAEPNERRGRERSDREEDN
jgi:hypothetical protein